MSALHRIVNRARLQRDAKAQRKLANKHAVIHHSQFLIESLEPRILLSGDVVPVPLMADLSNAADPAPIVSPYDSAEPVALPNDTIDSKLTIAPQLLDSETASHGVADDNNDTLTIAPQALDETPNRASDANNQSAEDTPFELAPVNQVVHWIGGSGNWSDATHWVGGIVPNNNAAFNYQVVLDAVGNPTITVDLDVAIGTLTNTNGATVLVANGNLTVLQQTTNSASIQVTGATAQLSLSGTTSNSGSIQVTGANAQLNLSGTINNTGEILALLGKLNLNDASLNVTGANAQVKAIGAPTTMTRTNLTASAGGQIVFIGATTYVDGAQASYTIQASGMGSKIDLSHLTSMAGSNSSPFGNTLSIAASGGGEVDLAGAITGTTVITLSDATSILNVAAVTSLQDSGVNASNGATLNFSSLTKLTRVNIVANSGAQILFPTATTYVDGAQANYSIQASGVGSKIDLSHLTSMAGSNSSPFGNTLAITASGGGEVDLAGAITGTIALTLSDPNSVLNLAAVTGLSGVTLTASNGAVLNVANVISLQDTAINASNGTMLNFLTLTQLARVSLSATSGAKILFPVVVGYTDGAQASYTIQASGMGSKIDLSHLTSMAGSNSSPFGNTLSIAASGGGEVDLGGAITGTTVITLSDATSILNVAAVTSLQDIGITVSNSGTLNFAALTTLTRVNLTATTGGRILFPVATTYVDGAQASYTIQASGMGSKIDLSHLTSMAGSNSSPFGNTLSIAASGGGEVDLAGAITGTTVITLSDATSILNVAAVTSLQDSGVNASNGATLNFSSLTKLTRVNIVANSGAQILFPTATTYVDGAQANYSIQASGVGSKIDLSHLTSMAGSNSSPFGNTLAITASGSGEVDLAGAITGTIALTLSDPNSVLNLAAVTGLSGVTLTASNGAVLNVANVISLQDTAINASNGTMLNFLTLTQLARVSLSATSGAKILFPVVVGYTDGAQASYTIQASGMGSKIDLSHLTSMAGSNSSPFGNTLSIAASGGGEVDLGGAITGTTVITLSDATSILNVAAVTSLQDIGITVSNSGTLNFAALTTLTRVNLTATTGGRILFPVATTYVDGAQASYTIQASGMGSKIDLSHLTSMAGSNSSPFGNTLSIAASGGGEVDLAGAITGTTVITLSDANSVLNLAAVTGLSGVTLTASNGATWVFPAGWNPNFGGGITLSTTGTGSKFVNLANLNLAGVTVTINPSASATDGSAFINQGVLNAQNGGILDINGSFQVNDLGIIAGRVGGAFNIAGNLLGGTHNADLFAPQATVRFDDSGTVAAPQLLEVMSQDVGSDSAGFSHNFVYGTLSLSNSTRVKLVDQSDNAFGVDREAVYVNSLIVPVGTTLDLNGFHLYARAAQIPGTIVGGTVTQIPDGGSVDTDIPTPGAISVAGQLDEWSFFARGGRSITVAVDSGGGPLLAPKLNFAHVDLVDSNNIILASKDGTASGQTVTLNDIVIPADGTYRVRVRAPNSNTTATGNYQIAIWDSTPDVHPLVINQQVTGTIETPFSVDRWVFSAVANQQIQFDLVNRSQNNIEFDLTGPNGFIGFTNRSTDSDLITLPSSGSYIVTAHGTGGQFGGDYAFKLVQTPTAELNLGTFFTGQFAGSGQAQLFKINVPVSNPLKVILDDDATNNVNELYLKFGAPPTRADYDYRFTSEASADQEILVPMAYAGTWYALIYGNTIRTNSAYDLSVASNGVFLTGVTPDHYASGATATVTVTGAGFDATTSLALVGTNSILIPAINTRVESNSRMTATFSLNGLSQGMYSVIASELSNVFDALEDAFTVTGAGAAHLETRLVLPSTVGRHAVSTLYVDYSNTGNEAMAAPLLVLQSGDADNSDRPLITLDRSRLTSGFWTNAIPAGFANSVQFLATGSTPGVLQPGESGRMPVYFAGLQQPWNFSDSRVEFSIGILNVTNDVPVDWDSLKGQMRPDYVRPDAWDAIWNNFTSQVGNTWGSYLRALDENAVYLASLGAAPTDITRLLGFELRQAEAFNPIRYLATSTSADLPAPGEDLIFSLAFAQPISRRFEIGPLGRGWTHNWQRFLTAATDGTVAITDMTGTPRIFQPDSRAYAAPVVASGLLFITGPIPSPTPTNVHYIAAPGDHGILSSYIDGTYMLTETDGTQYHFREDGTLDFVRDPNDNRITSTYANGVLTRLTHSSGQSLTISYNGAGRITSVTDSDGRQTLYAYDVSNQHLMSVHDYAGRLTNYSYITGEGLAREHALGEVAFPDGSHRYYTYDGRGRLSSTFRDAGTEVWNFSYDSTGTVTVTDAAGHPWEVFFDDWGTILKGVNPLGNSVLLSLDNQRNLTAITDPAGLRTLLQYDSRGNLTRFTDAMGHAMNFTYTTDFNRLDKFTDANGNLTDYNYDSRGNLISIIDEDGSQERWSYDTLGQSTTRTNRRGMPIGFTYTADGQINRKTYADGTHVDYQYDAWGNVISASDNNGTTTFTYDANDYLIRVDYPGAGEKWLAFTYDAGGRRASSTDQLGHQLRYQYDLAGRLSRISNESNEQLVLYEYDSVGRVERKTVGNGVYTTYEYDAAGHLLHLRNLKTDEMLLSHFDYTYDSRGRRSSMSTSDGVWSYEYDDIGELTRAVFTSNNPLFPNQDVRYIYDAMGNRVRSIENGSTRDYTTNSLNQYSRAGDTTYTFDFDGNLVSESSSSGTVTYSYDSENRLIAVQKGADAWTYTYDSFGQRVESSHNGVSTIYTIDPIGFGNVVGEYDSSGNLIANYDHGFGLLSRAAAGSSAWYTFDAIGSVAELTDGLGAILNHYSYAPFGSVLQATTLISNQFQFIGEFGTGADSTGLTFMRARQYAADLGRFLQPDPIGIVAGPNLYTYVRNIPTVLVDPIGLCSDPLNELGKDLGFGLGRDIGVGLGTAVLGGFLFEAGLPIWGGVVLVGGFGYLIWSSFDTGHSIVDTAGSLLDRGSDLLRNNLAGGSGSSSSNGSSNGGSYCAPSEKPTPAPKPKTDPGDDDDSGAVGGFDPNQKLGPEGSGPSNFVSGDISLPYRIDFENDAKATASAQQVIITDQLSSNLDWSTFTLTEVSFGDNIISVPANVQHFQTSVPVTYNGVSFNVEIEAGINLTTGNVFAYLFSVDPKTGLPPNVLIGLLPPEDGTGRGQGHISYTIRPKTELATGTPIRNVAAIVFDGQPQIATNQVDPHDASKGTDPTKEALVTIDAGTPTSSVNALPTIVNTQNFTVSWAGQDDAGGSGIASYDIFVSDNGGVSTLFLDDTTETSATFNGQGGHTYRFYSVAMDNVRNEEVAPPSADAVTTVASTNMLTVTSITRTASGFVAQLSRAIDPSVLNLYDTENGGFGPADVTLVGATQGSIHGSLFMNQARDEITFIQTGGVLAPDTYTVTLRSGSNGFKDAAAELLDGNSDGIPGDNYQGSFTVAPSNAVVVSLPDFSRGARQPVDVPATSTNLPISLSNAAGVTSVKLTLNYDTALLTISDVIAVPAGGQVQAIYTAGQVQINFTSLIPLSAGVAELVKLAASVPSGATYGLTEILHITDVTINNGAIAAVADESFHVAAYLGDATGNRGYSSLDAQRVLRVAAGLDSGFAAYPVIDPVLIGDITGNGQISSLDATRILQFVAGIPTGQIPPLPASTLPAAANSNALQSVREVPMLTNDTTVPSSSIAAITNSLSDEATNAAGNGLTLNLAQSAALSKETGKEWLFFTA